ncbi:MAG TPA: thiamine pyrophosphate-binding protein [Solirubrobacteraceae bacterium]
MANLTIDDAPRRAGETTAGAGELPAFEAVAATLADLGVDTVFGVLGSGNFRLVERLTSRHGVSYHWARHETAAVTMADAWARVTARVGVCTVHQGPGLTNAMTGLAEAAKARTPLVVVAGEVATTAVAVNQRIDQDRLARATGARAERVIRGHTAVRDTLRAWRRALSERAPVVLSFPVDVQDEPCPAPAGDVAIDVPAPVEPSASAIAAVADLVERARRPLVLAGRGAVLSGARGPLEDLAERIGALLATSAPAHGLFAGSPWSLGISGGFAAPLAQELLPQADLVLAFGASLNHWTTRRGELIGAHARIVQCDSDPTALREHVPLLGDAGAAARALANELERRGVHAGPHRWDLEALGDAGWQIAGETGPGTVDPRSLLIHLDAKLPAQRTLATDAGHFQGFPPMHLRVPDAQGFVMTQAFQSIGLGVATGIGAAIARPDRPAVAVVGDGGLMMSLGELDSAAAQRLALLVVVLDDGAYGAEVHHFGPMGERTALVEFGQRDFAGVARALGMPAQVVRSLADLDAGPLDDWIDAPRGPFLLDCKVDPRIRAEWLQEAFRGGA